MQKIFNFLSRLGVTPGLTFRCDIEDGVGPILSPNPSVNRMQPRAIASSSPVSATRYTERRFYIAPPKRIRGEWSAKPLYVRDKFL